MSFSLEVKKEILNQEFSKEQAYDFVFGLVVSSKIKNKNIYLITINNYQILSIVINMLHKLNLHFSKDKKNKNIIILKNFNHNIVKYYSAFFSGIFVGGGSISDPNSIFYHLELRFYNDNFSLISQNYLHNNNFHFIKIKRRKNWILYIKKSEIIMDFIKVIKAFNSLILFENIRINREFRNQLKKYSNLDSYNQMKIAKSSNQFQKMYKFLKNNNLEHLFNDNELLFFKIKFDNMYSSLNELTKKFEKKIQIKRSKSSLNHYIYKLKKIYNDFNK